MPDERRVHRRRAVEVDLLDVGPGHVLGALMAVDEDQQTGIPLAEVAGALELQLLAILKGHPGASSCHPLSPQIVAGLWR